MSNIFTNIKIPIVCFILYIIPLVLNTILTLGNIVYETQLYMHYLPYMVLSFLLLSYVELNIGLKKFLMFLAIVYAMRLLCFSLYYKFKICNNKDSNCSVENRFTFKDEDGKEINGSERVEELCYDALLFPAIAFTLVLIFLNTKNMIIKTLCIIFMISLYIFIFYGNKTISFKNINCNEKEKLCYSFFSESFIYAVSLFSAFIIMK